MMITNCRSESVGSDSCATMRSPRAKPLESDYMVGIHINKN